MPVSMSVSARSSTARCASAFWRAIDTWAAKSLTSSNSSSAKRASVAEALDRQHALDTVRAAQRRNDQGAGGWAEIREVRDAIVGQLVLDQLRLAGAEHVAADALVVGNVSRP